MVASGTIRTSQVRERQRMIMNGKATVLRKGVIGDMIKKPWSDLIKRVGYYTLKVECQD